MKTLLCYLRQCKILLIRVYINVFSNLLKVIIFSSLSARELYKRGEDSVILEWMMDYKPEVGVNEFEEDNVDIFNDVDFNDNTIRC